LRPLLLVPATFVLAHAGFAALGPRYGGELTVGVRRVPAKGLTPWFPRGEGEPLATRLVHEGLVRLDADGFPVPGLAVRWSAGAGAREWQLELAPGARFHDDAPVVAEDAVRSLRRFLRSGSPAAARLAATLEGGSAFRGRDTEALPGLAALDERRLSLRLLDAQAAPLAPLAAPAAAVVGPRGQGCGAFLPALQVPGRSLALTAFGSHVRGRPYLDRLNLKAVTDQATARVELREGGLDLALGEPGESRLIATLILLLDPSRPPFDRPASRDAVASAFATDAIAALVSGAKARPGLLAPPLLPSPLEVPAPAGTVSGSIMLAVADDVPPLASQRVVAALGALGLRTTAAPVSSDAAPTARAHARLFLWSPEVAEAGLALSELAAVAPHSRIAREALDAAEWELDLDRRRAALAEADAALRADRFLVPLCLLPVTFGARPGVHGARLDASGLLLEDAWTEP
jgi:ABC-type transport system substrate-binding protein